MVGRWKWEGNWKLVVARIPIKIAYMIYNDTSIHVEISVAIGTCDNVIEKIMKASLQI